MGIDPFVYRLTFWGAAVEPFEVRAGRPGQLASWPMGTLQLGILLSDRPSGRGKDFAARYLPTCSRLVSTS